MIDIIHRPTDRLSRRFRRRAECSAVYRCIATSVASTDYHFPSIDAAHNSYRTLIHLLTHFSLWYSAFSAGGHGKWRHSIFRC